jgi:EAL and modified HD-GYP domain-containing signal transduction protein
MDVFIARQPIFDRHKRIYAYELLFREDMSNVFPNVDGNIATSRLLSTAFFTVGVEKFVGDKRAFINFTEELLLSGAASVFTCRKITIEVLENVNPSPEVTEACFQLIKEGFHLALDDFVFSEEWLPLVKVAKIIKIDFQDLKENQIRSCIEKIKPYEGKLLAEKIETYAEYQLALDMGFSYFQGFFFATPEIQKHKEISSSQGTLLSLLSEVNKTDFDPDSIERLINQDVSISFKLLKYLNSAYFSRVARISSIKQAVVFLGARGIQQFVSLIVVAKLSESKPNELIRSSVIRARFLERLAENIGRENPGNCFILGLFSHIDAILDHSMEYLMAQLPLSNAIKESLTSHRGELAIFLRAIEEYESGEWENFESIVKTLGVNSAKIPEFYLDALSWADSI